MSENKVKKEDVCKIKVALIFLNRSGGTLKCSVLLAESLSEMAELKAFVSSDADCDILKNRACFTKVTTGTGRANNFLNTINPLNYYRIIQKIKSFDPDVIHFPIEHVWNSVLFLALKKYPVVQTIHDPVRHSGEGNLFYDYLRHLAIQRADRIIVLSKQFERSFERFGIKSDDIDVIPHGSFAFDREISEPPLKRQVLFAGRINKYKGLDVLLKAFAIMQHSIPGASLIIAGKGDVEPYRHLLDKVNNVTLINRYVTEEELRELHSDCDFVVVPYIDASQSGVIAVAAANGRAVISSDVGGLSEQIVDGKTGFLVEKSNPQILADKIMTLLNNDNLILTMGKNARQFFREKYCWEVISRRTKETCTKSIENHRANSRKNRLILLLSAGKNLVVEKLSK
ncbi:glycosyl transferase, group 1 family protein [Chitinispirillum alkaliphilum]|nr:glycosyl transferase, group 1 family protein [Chitinispirillum alkaliphilum]